SRDGARKLKRCESSWPESAQNVCKRRQRRSQLQRTIRRGSCKRKTKPCARVWLTVRRPGSRRLLTLSSCGTGKDCCEVQWKCCKLQRTVWKWRARGFPKRFQN